MNLIKMNHYPCKREQHFIFTNANKEKILDVIITKNDLQKIREEFYDYILKDTTFVKHDLTGYKAEIAIEKTLEVIGNNKSFIINPALKMGNMPYYMSCLAITNSDNELTFYLFSPVVEKKLYQGDSKKKLCSQYQNIVAIILNNDMFDKYDINIKIVRLDNDKNNIQIDYLDDTKFSEKYMNDYAPVFCDNLHLDKEPNYSRRCKKECKYSSECALPNFSILDFDLGSGRWKKVDNLIDKYGNLDINNLDNNEVSELGNMNKMRFELNNKNSNDSSYLIDKDVLDSFLGKINQPCIHLDFEGYTSIYSQPNYWKNAQIIFSYSIHKVDENNQIKSHSFNIVDPRDNNFESIIPKLFDDLLGSEPIVVHHKDYEVSRFKDLKKVYPHYSEEIDNIIGRIVDLEELFINGGFCVKGQKSNSLKDIVSSLNIDTYQGLKIVKGDDCAYQYKEMFDNNVYDKELIDEIRKYNTADTLAQIKIIDKIKMFLSLKDIRKV